MNCVRPPLLKKPARGFGWSCGPCSRRQEKKLEARNTPNVGEKGPDGEEEEFVDEEEEEHGANSITGSGSSPDHMEIQSSGTRPPTAEQIAQAKLWPFRYLGIHCRVEDALDYDDRIYPRASSRLGPKHQANVQMWYGRPVQLVKPLDVKRKALKGNSHKKDAKMTKDTFAAFEADKLARERRPKWIIDEPPGYVPRGEHHQYGDPSSTAQVNFRLPEVGEHSSRGFDASNNDLTIEREDLVDQYINQAKPLAVLFGLKEHSTNFLDKALELLISNNYQCEKALQQLRNVNKRKDLKEPDFSKEEVKKFEEGVMRYGSELRLVSKHVGKTQKHGEVVRFYYMWKKTPRGKQIWGNYEGRKGKKQQKLTDSKLVDDVADDVDDSAFDNNKAAMRKRGFECKFCLTRASPQWRRAPTTAPGTTVPIEPGLKGSKDKNAHLMLALCQRCAYLWRCYAITWENPDEVAKKVASGGGRAWKRRVDEELLAELTTANVANSISVSTTAAAAAASLGVEIPANLTTQPGQEGSKKKQKLGSEVPVVATAQSFVPIEPPKKKVVEKPPEPPLIPEQPRRRILPCAVCDEFGAGEEMLDEYLSCGRCRLSVHRSCYGVSEERAKDKWNCDMCANDISHQLSTNYDCVLCSVREYADKELMEVPKPSHKKKNDREKEKERLERELLINATENYYRSQREKGRPEQPRQPLKRTANNNWVHVVCAIFHHEIKFADPMRLEPAEGFGAIVNAKFSAKCKLCKKAEGACVNCGHCQAAFHVACAQQFGYQLGFDINPVKGSRANSVNLIEVNGDKGTATAVIYCKEHAKSFYNKDDKKGIHAMAEICELSSQPELSANALQAFVRTHKKADTSLTGTLRKALMLDSATNTATQMSHASGSQRNSTVSLANGVTHANGIVAPLRPSQVSPGAVTIRSDEVDQDGDRVIHLDHTVPVVAQSKECLVCGTKVSPKWHERSPRDTKAAKPALQSESVEESSSLPSPKELSNGHLEPSVNLREDSELTKEYLQIAVAPTVNGEAEEKTQIEHCPNDEAKENVDTYALVNGENMQAAPSPADAKADLPTFLCNRCHQHKRHDLTPPRNLTPVHDLSQGTIQPEALPPAQAVLEVEPRTSTPPPSSRSIVALSPASVSSVAPVNITVSSGSGPTSPQAPLAWPSQVAQASSHDPYHSWPTQSGPVSLPASTSALGQTQVSVSATASAPAPVPGPYYHGQDRHPNNLPHSPPVTAPPPLPHHYPPQPPPLPHHAPSYTSSHPPQNYRDSRGVIHRGLPPQYHVPHLVNGVQLEPPSFQYRRDSSGNLFQVPYVPPSMRAQQQQPPPPPPPPPQQQPLPTSGTALRSPRVHDRTPQGPHGPPEAAENPFAVPSASHSPARQAYGGVYGSPSGIHERPETPPNGYARDGRWTTEGPMANGASASPSLRNLIH